ncbi:aspartate/glutamate racemase family protein [Acidobacteriota bacterium]
MKILIINPNSDPQMSRSIERTAVNFVRGEYEVECVPNPGAPAFIETYLDEMQSVPGMVQIIRERQDEYDAFVVACHSDPGLDVLKEVSLRPVVGISEASMKIASMLGDRFSVLSDNLHSVPNKESLVRKYGLQDSLASVRAPTEEMQNLDDEEKYMGMARSAVADDLAEVIVLGCAAMTGLDKPIQEKLGIPVLDGIICALFIACGLVKYGVSISKVRRYDPEA